MIERYAVATLALALGAGLALAAPPASQDACLEQSFALAEKAANKKLDKAAQTKVEGLLTALEGKCTSGDLAGAEADIKAVEAAIEGK